MADKNIPQRGSDEMSSMLDGTQGDKQHKSTDESQDTSRNSSGDTQATAKGGGEQRKKGRSLWVRILKWTGITVVGLIVLLLLGVGVAVWILKPERLTPLVENMASKMIDGKVEAGRVELTYWSTFPRLNVAVDTLDVISHSLRGLTPEQQAALPAGSDSLLRVEGFRGGVNLLRLLIGEIMLTDVEITRPRVRLVDVSPEISNYNIFPPDTVAPDTAKTLSVPDITFRRFRIVGNAPISYASLPDTLNFAVTLKGISLTGDDAPTYALQVDGDASSRLGDIDLRSLRIGMGGDIRWNHKKPYAIELRNFMADVNSIHTVTSTSVNFEKQLTVETLNFEMPAVAIDSIIALIPSDMRGELNAVKNNMSVGLKAKLLKPYKPVESPLPTMDVDVSMPRGTLTYDRLTLEALELAASAHIDGERPEQSTITLSNLYASGEGVTVSLTAKASDIFADPLVEGTFKGGVRIDRLPRKLLEQYDIQAKGLLTADASFRGRQSYLTRENFHRLNVDGEVRLSNLSVACPMIPVDLTAGHMDLKFGTTTSFTGPKTGFTADSLLTASLKIDTIHCAIQGMDLRGARWRGGIGMRNKASSVDTTMINPLGAVLSMDRLWFREVNAENSADTMRLNLRKLNVAASLKRYKDLDKQPLMNLSVGIDRMRMALGGNRVTLREAAAKLTVHPQAPRMNKRIRATLDSIRHANPSLAVDSAYRMALRLNPPRAPKGRRNNAAAQHETIDFGVDQSTASLMKRWRAEGSLTARRGRLFTPVWPLRNVVSGLDMTFNNDSINLKSLKLRSGRSDFRINGAITNLQRGLTSSGRQPLRMELTLKSDTIDVNQLTAAAFAGAAFSAKQEKGEDLGLGNTTNDDNDDDALERSITQAVDTAEAGPLLIPVNVNAHLTLSADNVIYSNFILHDFKGEAGLFDGALNLHNLSASSNVGALNLSALYEGLDPAQLRFAMGLKVNDFRVGSFMSLMPSLDSLMPLMQNLDGIIDADIAVASRVDSTMNLIIPSLDASVMIHGDSLVLLDAETFRKIGKWMLFKNKERNIIDSMTVKLDVHNSMLELYPFIFDIDRYKLGVFGTNDMNLNFKYHVSVLKSPIPFKFGINVSGNADKMKIRLGGAKVNDKTARMTMAIADTTRINLVNQIENVFRRGLRTARRAGNNVNVARGPRREALRIDESPADTISGADSLFFMDQGLIPRPDTVAAPVPAPEPSKKKKKK